MSIFKDLTGKQFGRLTVLSLAGRRNGSTIWECNCSCGKIVEIPRDGLVGGRTNSCGCWQKERAGNKNRKNLIGSQYGRLTVVAQTSKRLRGHVLWECKCICGNICEALGSRLGNGATRSCGCLRKETAIINGSVSIKTRKSPLQDVSGTTINGIQILRMSAKRNKDQHAYCFAICPGCKKEWEVLVYSLKSSKATQCKRCVRKKYVSRTATALLDKLENYLGIPIIREYPIEGKFFDGFIPVLKLIIESDGHYWHSMQEHKSNDLFKEQLVKTVGLQLIRVTNNSPADHEKALTKIIEAIEK